MELTREQKAGLKLVTTHIKRKYPFIIDLKPRIDDIKKYGTLMGVGIEFDLNKFYDITNTEPPERYVKSPFLMSMLEDNGSYLFRYVDEKYKSEFGSEYNDEVQRHINEYYKRLPDYMRLNGYCGWTKKQLEDHEKKKNFDRGWLLYSFGKNAVKMSVDFWMPKFNEKEYRAKKS